MTPVLVGPEVVNPDSGCVDDRTRAHLPLFTGVFRFRDRAHGFAATANYLGHPGVTQSCGASVNRGDSVRDGKTRVVGARIIVDRPARQPVAREAGLTLESLGRIQRVVPPRASASH